MRVMSPLRRLTLSIIFTFILMSLITGCRARDYRLSADRETYDILAEKSQDPRWQLPEVTVERPAESRLHDPHDPDNPPMPPDDPAASRYMPHFDESNGGGPPPPVENPGWRQSLELSESGKLVLSPKRAVKLSLLHSREYQSRLEDLYLTALALTFERFEFSVQWFLGSTTNAEHVKNGPEGHESNTVDTDTHLGFSRALSAGGQFLVDIANNLFWEFSGADVHTVSTNIAISFLQPLLRGAGRKVRLEQLTQAERDVLFDVRDFAQFRKRFYVNTFAGGSGFLSLLSELQGIRNLEANLASLERNLRLHEALANAGIVSRIQVDQVFQSFQRARLSLVRAQNDFETALDSYKIQLGLPPDLDDELDDSLLSPFELTSSALNSLEHEVDQLLGSLRRLERAPTLAELQSGTRQLSAFNSRLEQFRRQVVIELNRWTSKNRSSSGVGSERSVSREGTTQRQLATRLEDLRQELADLQRAITTSEAEIPEAQPNESSENLQELARRQLLRLGDLFVIQTQIRAYLIELEPVQYGAVGAVKVALTDRLDLMNRRAQVVDAWRRVNVAADGLGTDLDIILEANLGNEPGSTKPFKFSSEGSSYRAGIQFDGPLNRLAERNVYRRVLIDYQRARRSYMALVDQITQEVRRDLRQLRADELNFEISRESLIAAARQVEQAREQLMAPGLAGDSSNTQDVLDALNTLLEAKNSLIRIWVSYETNRLELLLDLEELELDNAGLPKSLETKNDE